MLTIWDILITLNKEVTFVWSNSPGLPHIILVLTRYCNLVSLIYANYRTSPFPIYWYIHELSQPFPLILVLSGLGDNGSKLVGLLVLSMRSSHSSAKSISSSECFTISNCPTRLTPCTAFLPLCKMQSPSGDLWCFGVGILPFLQRYAVVLCATL